MVSLQSGGAGDCYRRLLQPHGTARQASPADQPGPAAARGRGAPCPPAGRHCQHLRLWGGEGGGGGGPEEQPALVELGRPAAAAQGRGSGFIYYRV
jgi:hypothetical protein